MIYERNGKPGEPPPKRKKRVHFNVDLDDDE